MQKIGQYPVDKFKKRNYSPCRNNNWSQNNQPLKKQIQYPRRSEKLSHGYNLSQIYTNEVRRKKGKKRFLDGNHSKNDRFTQKNDHLYKNCFFYWTETFYPMKVSLVLRREINHGQQRTNYSRG